MERLPAIPPPSAPALRRRPVLPAARWARPAATALVAVLPALVGAAWRHREGSRRATGADPPAAPYALERTELWVDRRRLGRVRLHVRATRIIGTTAGASLGAGREPGPRSGWTAALGLIVRLLAIAAGSVRPAGSRAVRR